MSNIITFIKAPKITSFYPAVGFPGTNFSVAGDDLEDVEHLYFMDVFDNKVNKRNPADTIKYVII